MELTKEQLIEWYRVRANLAEKAVPAALARGFVEEAESFRHQGEFHTEAVRILSE